jgi:hypothetical protein
LVIAGLARTSSKKEWKQVTKNYQTKSGDWSMPGDTGLYRKVFRITGEQSPNVRLALAQTARGERPTGEVLVPGLLEYQEYLIRRKMWSEQLQTVGLDARWYEGKGEKLYPKEWLDRAAEVAKSLEGKSRRVEAVGIDVSEGGDDVVWTAVDSLGIIEQGYMDLWHGEGKKSGRQSDTSVIPDQTIGLINRFRVPAEKIYMDLGGGGKQHVDVLREKRGYDVRGIAFGGAPRLPMTWGRTAFQDKFDIDEQRRVYKNARAEMYGELRHLLDPSLNPDGFGIPLKLQELRRQMKPIRLDYNEHGVMFVIPKRRPAPAGRTQSTVQTLETLLGCSPDELDSLVLATFALVEKQTEIYVGAL